MIYILTNDKSAIPAALKIFKIEDSFINIPIGSIIILFSYKKLISEKDLNKYDFYNVHNSILPKYRGLHAFSWAIINGDKFLGYTLHKVDKGVDSGEIVSQIKFKIESSDTINEAFEKANKTIEDWLPTQLIKIKNGDFILTPQDEKNATYTKKRTEADNKINWESKSNNIHNLIRAVAPPYTDGAYTFYNQEKLFIEKSSLITKNAYQYQPSGKVVAKFKDKGVLVKTADSVILIERVTHRKISISADNLFNTIGDGINSFK